MRFWLSKSSEVPLREQLSTQIMLGIVSQDLPPGQRLPSTRDLARRFRIHPNTVSAVYRELAARGWVEFRKGSGVYVRPIKTDVTLDAKLELDQLISSFLQVARGRGFGLSEIQERVKRWLEVQPPDRFLIIENDEELRRILLTEVREATAFPVVSAGLDDSLRFLTGSVPLALYGHAEAVRAALPPDTALLVLRSRSVPESLRGEAPPPPEALIAVVSHWPDFLRWSRTILVAAGLDPGALNFRDARERGWQKGLAACDLVITDALTAASLPAGCRARIFRMLADSSLAELNDYVAQFLARE